MDLTSMNGEFSQLLTELGMSKARFAEIAGVSKNTVYGWKEAPKWALALLELMAKVRRLAKDCQ